jgi:serine/threonine-protein kinase
MSVKAGDSLGHYVILEEIGRGGMATVYRARQESLRRDVAIKVLPDFFATDEQFRDRFAREAATIGRLRHPNIVTVFDFGEESGTPYIVTEFVDGKTLAARIDSAMPFDEVLGILRPLASAIDYAHEHEVLHRDIKPSNVILDADGSPVLTDFGLSRIVGSMPPLTRTGLPIGTPEYMAPEVSSGGPASPGADRYALAVMAFEMLTGQLPYRAEAPLAVLFAHMNAPTPKVSERRPDTPAAIDEVLLKALDKDPEQRYESARDFVEALSLAALPSPSATSQPEETVRPSVTDDGAAQAQHIPTGQSSGRAPDDYKDRGILFRAAAEAVQHVVILVPIGIAALALGYQIILAPEAGGDGWAQAIAGGAAVVALAATGLILPGKYREVADASDASHWRERDARLNQELEKLDESLRVGFAGAESSEGARVLERLSGEFHQLAPSFDREPGNSLTTAQIPGLARETYRRGLSVLVDALELTTTASTPGAERLSLEIKSLEREIAELQRQGGQAQRLAIRTQALNSHRERLRMLEDLQVHIDQLFYQAQQCEAALHRTRISLAALRVGGDSGASVESVTRALQRTIEQARTVQEEVRRSGY